MGYELDFLYPRAKVEDTIIFNTNLWTSEDKLIMAPMHALTGYAFRNAFDKSFPQSIDKAVTPFISLTHGSLGYSRRKYFDVLKENNLSNIEIIPQVLGNDSKGIIELSNTLVSLGYKELNWNLGCPFERVMRKDRGAALLKDTKRIERIISEVINKIQISFSIKVRLGFETTDDIYRLIPIINSYPINNVIIHPRLGVDKYESKVDLDCFEDVAKQINKRIIYNGDIFSKEDFKKLKLRFPQINEWMIGRGLLFNPLLPSEIKSIEYPNKKERILAFHNELIKGAKSVNKIKEYWKYFAVGLKWNKEKIELLLKTETLEELDNLIKDII